MHTGCMEVHGRNQENKSNSNPMLEIQGAADVEQASTGHEHFRNPTKPLSHTWAWSRRRDGRNGLARVQSTHVRM